LEDFPMNKSRKGIDWVSVMQGYITTDVSLRDIAAKLGCNIHAVERRSALDGWSAARDKFRAQVGHRAQALQVETRAHKLKDWNDNDLKLAKAIRGQATREFNRAAQSGTVDINTLRNVASVIESTQRIGRLALGATTDNQGNINDPNGDGIAAPRLGDFYASVKFEGPTEGAATPEKPPEDDEPTRH
jgi:hypothetical protein